MTPELRSYILAFGKPESPAPDLSPGEYPQVIATAPRDGRVIEITAIEENGELTPADVIAIRESHAEVTDLATQYGVSEKTIKDVKENRTWSHL
jgi:hypothetical protein